MATLRASGPQRTAQSPGFRADWWLTGSTHQNGAPIIAIYLDVRNTSGGPDTVDFDLKFSKDRLGRIRRNGEGDSPVKSAGQLVADHGPKGDVGSESGRLLLASTRAGLAKDARPSRTHLEPNVGFRQGRPGAILPDRHDYHQAHGGPQPLVRYVALPSVRIPLGE